MSQITGQSMIPEFMPQGKTSRKEFFSALQKTIAVLPQLQCLCWDITEAYVWSLKKVETARLKAEGQKEYVGGLIIITLVPLTLDPSDM